MIHDDADDDSRECLNVYEFCVERYEYVQNVYDFFWCVCVCVFTRTHNLN